MAFQDKTLKCKDCGQDFVWTASEQEFYERKGFHNEPVRCTNCRQAKKTRMGDRKQLFEITCSQCGKPDQVPFQPRGDRPVLCRDCFYKQKQQGA